VDKYTWCDVGSSYLPGELIAAFLWAQMEEAESITEKRIEIWNCYHHGFDELVKQGYIKQPVTPEGCEHNAHMYYLLLAEGIDRDALLNNLKEKAINAVFHYVPLHSSPAGLEFSDGMGKLVNTNLLSERVIRLPLWVGLSTEQQDEVVAVLSSRLKEGIWY